MSELKNIPNIPFFRLYANMFDFKTRTKRKDYVIDLLCLIFVNALLLFIYQLLIGTGIIKNNFKGVLLLPLFVIGAANFVAVLALFARRLRDTGNSPYLLLLLLAGIGWLVIFIICLFKSKEEGGDNNDSVNKVLIAVAIIFGLGLLIAILGIIMISLAIKRCKDDMHQVITDLDQYEECLGKLEGASELMPSLDELGQTTNITFSYRKDVNGIFSSENGEGIGLWVTYDESNYFTAKSSLANYRYLTDSEAETSTYFYVASFDYKGYHFQIVPNIPQDDIVDEYYDINQFMMIGYNDEDYKISYLYFDAPKLREIYPSINEQQEDETMQRFIIEYFWWND